MKQAMTTTQQPEALVFADDRPTSTSDDLYQWSFDTEELIRRHHARITKLEDVADMAIKRIKELEAQLSAIGAGGVEPLRKQARPRTPQREGVMRNWTVARYPSGSWITGGRPDDPDYAECEVWVIGAETRDAAKRKAQAKRAYEKNRLKSKHGEQANG